MLVTLALTWGCMTRRTEDVRVRGAETLRVIGPAPGDVALRSDFSYEAGVARGVVHFSAHCRRAMVAEESLDSWRVVRPNYGAGFAALTGGVALGLGSGTLLAHAPDFSNVDRCTYDDSGEEHCSSPRDFAIGLGLVGAVTSIAMMSAGVTTFVSKSERTRENSVPQTPVVTEIRGNRVACGHGPVAGLAVSLLRGEEPISAAVTNRVGAVAFAVPPWVSGELAVVVDSVPPGLSFARRGDVIGLVSLPAVAPEPNAVPVTDSADHSPGDALE
jgi:hypothetical protein